MCTQVRTQRKQLPRDMHVHVPPWGWVPSRLPPTGIVEIKEWNTHNKNHTFYMSSVASYFKKPITPSILWPCNCIITCVDRKWQKTVQLLRFNCSVLHIIEFTVKQKTSLQNEIISNLGQCILCILMLHNMIKSHKFLCIPSEIETKFICAFDQKQPTE